jgi:hypothetical protein
MAGPLPLRRAGRRGPDLAPGAWDRSGGMEWWWWWARRACGRGGVWGTPHRTGNGGGGGGVVDVVAGCSPAWLPARSPCGTDRGVGSGWWVPGSQQAGEELDPFGAT